MKWLHNLLKGVSLTGALFVFQACYGTPMSPLWDEDGTAPMSFSLVSRSTGEPVGGIEIWGNDGRGENDRVLGVSDADGHCRVELHYWRNIPGPVLHFVDPEEQFAVKDTTLSDLRERDILIKLDSVR